MHAWEKTCLRGRFMHAWLRFHAWMTFQSHACMVSWSCMHAVSCVMYACVPLMRYIEKTEHETR